MTDKHYAHELSAYFFIQILSIIKKLLTFFSLTERLNKKKLFLF